MGSFVQNRIDENFDKMKNQVMKEIQDMHLKLQDKLWTKEQMDLFDKVSRHYFLARTFFDDLARENITLLATKDKTDILKEPAGPFFGGRQKSIPTLVPPQQPIKGQRGIQPLNPLALKPSLLKSKMDALGWLA